MPAARRDALPLAPLLHAYASAGLPNLAQLHALPGLGRRFAAILGASARFLYSDFLDTASPAKLLDALARFHGEVVPLPLHGATLRSRAGFLRHAVSFLLRGEGTWPSKLAAVLASEGPYRVAGLGPTFWSAVAQGTNPGKLPAWTAATWAGLERLGLAPLGPAADASDRYEAFVNAHVRIRRLAPALSSLHIDHFLSLVASMRGRSLPAPNVLDADHLAEAIRQVRHGDGLRRLLKERGQALAQAQDMLQAALDAGDGKRLGDALALSDPVAAARCPLDWGAHPSLIEHARSLYAGDDPEAALEAFHRAALPGAGSWLPAAVLHLRDPLRWLTYGEEMRHAHSLIDDGTGPDDPPAQRYRLFAEACAAIRERHVLHPLELPLVLVRLARPAERPAEFAGFCSDTFRFLGELRECNSRTWMDAQRGRYRFAVREPLVELCKALAERYVEPHLRVLHGWPLDTRAAPGHALTSICKNSFGRGGPYSSALWIAFCRPGRVGVQLFVHLDASGVRFGLRLGMGCADLARLRTALERHGDAIWHLLKARGADAHCLFGLADRPGSLRPLTSADDLREWGQARSLEASAGAPAEADLVEAILATFDRLLPLAGCCHEADAGAFLRRLGGDAGQGYREADFRQQTFLPAEWLERATELLRLKKQLILQGVPGTGKTHVARCLGRLLSGGDEAALRVVQFHPAFSYEEFVEGIKVRTVEIDGRHEVTYPVEDGLLLDFAARASANPSRPHVLVIDEINRGNLPRIFGELLYLLEYRGEAVELPCSRRRFALPGNLILLGTMNAADRSIAPVDLALRRRFSFLPLEPDEAVLAAWLAAHPPSAGPAFASRVLGLFARLNARLKADVGLHAQVGHSHFMVPNLDESRLRVVWQHHVTPLLEESCAGQPARAKALAGLIEPSHRGATS